MKIYSPKLTNGALKWCMEKGVVVNCECCGCIKCESSSLESAFLSYYQPIRLLQIYQFFN